MEPGDKCIHADQHKSYDYDAQQTYEQQSAKAARSDISYSLFAIVASSIVLLISIVLLALKAREKFQELQQGIQEAQRRKKHG